MGCNLTCPPKAISAGPVTWLGIAGGGRVFYHRMGLGRAQIAQPNAAMTPVISDPGPDGLITTGSLVVEARVEPWPGRDVCILRYGAKDRWLRGVIITYRADGRLVVDMVQGDELRRTSVAIAPVIGECDLRITLSWDAPARAGVLSVEHLDAETLHQTRFHDPLPLPHIDGERLVKSASTDHEHTPDNAAILSLGVAQGIAPVALAPGLAEGSQIDTPCGLRPIEDLRPGDLVLTNSGEAKPVRHLAARQVPALGLMRPLQLRAPFLGLSHDVLIAPHQRLLLSGGEAEYLYGEDAVMIHARHLRHGHAARWATPRPLVRYYAVLLDSHDCLSLQGLWCESLFVGPMVPDMLRTTVLSDMPPLNVPIHKLMPTPSLSRFEARNLVTALHA